MGIYPKLWFYDSYTRYIPICWWLLQTYIVWWSRINSLDYLRLYECGSRRYGDQKIKVCWKDSEPVLSLIMYEQWSYFGGRLFGRQMSHAKFFSDIWIIHTITIKKRHVVDCCYVEQSGISFFVIYPQRSVLHFEKRHFWNDFGRSRSIVRTKR